MGKYRYSLEEQEVHISWDAKDRTAIIDTNNQQEIRRLDRLCREAPQTYECIFEDPQYGAKRYRCLARWIRYGKPANRKPLTEEQKRNVAARLNSSRQNRF